MKKDIEWLKEEIPNLRGYAVVVDEIDGGLKPVTTISVKDVCKLIDQLDEPEVLSQEWIDKHTYYEDEYDFYYADPDELQNLLVPKQEGYNQQAYRDGFKEGERQTAEYFESITEEPSQEQVQKYLSEHGIEVVDKEPETVADVIADFYKSLERLKGVLGTKVEELEE